VGPDYFQVNRIALLRGRAFTEHDNAAAPRVAIVNQFMANRFWPGQDAIGKRFRAVEAKGKVGPWMEIVGVCRDGKYTWIFDDPRPYYFLPLEQKFLSLHALQIRTSGRPEALASAVLREVHALDAELPVYDVMTMEQGLEGGNGFFLIRMGAIFAGALGSLGLALAVVGVYGVVSFAASQRTHEIGVRVALGAQRADILKLIVGQGLGLVSIGIGIGVAASLLLARAVAKMLFGISAYDPITFVGVALLLGAVAALACWFPARRAAGVDPLVALRYE
jgi:putative ABC transport system permease protein